MSEKRRSQRVPYNVTIQLAGMQPGAPTALAQPARALDVNQQGVLLECRSKFEPGTEIMVHHPKTFQTGLFKVVRVKPSPGGAAWHLGAEIVEPIGVDFWTLPSEPPQQ